MNVQFIQTNSFILLVLFQRFKISNKTCYLKIIESSEIFMQNIYYLTCKLNNFFKGTAEIFNKY